MKRSILISLICVFSLTNCSTNNNDNNNQGSNVKSFWHMVHVSGGIQGVDIDYDLYDIIWTFDENNDILIVTNTNSDENLEDGLNTGTYSYSAVTNDNIIYFLMIDDTEYGSITVNESQLVIDQNITSSGTGADGYIYSFQRVIVSGN